MDRHRDLAKQQQVAALRELFDRSRVLPDDGDRPVGGDSPHPEAPDAGDTAGAAAPRHAAPARLIAAARPAWLMAVAALLAVGAVALIAWLNRPVPATVPTPVSGAAAVHPEDAPAGAQSAAPVTTGTSAEAPPSDPAIVVSVIGMVHAPGLVTLPAGSRVSDAIAAAGGALPEADLTTLNLARRLVDGEQIAVGIPDGNDPGTASTAPDGTSSATPTAKVNLNTATAEQLDELPGIGPVLAQRIVQYRAANGSFTSVDDLAAVSGVGPATLDELRDLVTV